MNIKGRYYAGMASKKVSVDAMQAQSMGMLAPMEGLATLARFLQCQSSDSTIVGVASQTYWRLLLLVVEEKPSMFASLYELHDANVKV